MFLFRGYTIRTHKVKYNQSLKWNFDSHLQKREKCFCSNIMFLHCTLCKKKISQEKNWFYKIHELLAKFSLFTHKKKSGLCCLCLILNFQSRYSWFCCTILSLYRIQFLLKSKMFLINRHAQNRYWVWRRVFHKINAIRFRVFEA